LNRKRDTKFILVATSRGFTCAIAVALPNTITCLPAALAA